jgi:hypothetical protein
LSHAYRGGAHDTDSATGDHTVQELSPGQGGLGFLLRLFFGLLLHGLPAVFGVLKMGLVNNPIETGLKILKNNSFDYTHLP